MNCRRVQKLLPLYIEGDLRAALSARVASHIEWCGVCNWLADEYKQSQEWLRSSVAQEFDSALLESIKSGALARIAASRRKAMPFAHLAHPWTRRYSLALAMTMLVICAILIFHSYQARNEAQPTTKVAARETPATERRGPTAVTETAPHSAAPKKHRRSVAHIVKATVPIEPPRPELSLTHPRANQIDQPIEPKETLRIEIQTADPLIRIIWFAPKETDSHQTKTATD